MRAHRLPRAQARIASAAVREIELELMEQVRYCRALRATMGRGDLFGARLKYSAMERVLEPVTDLTQARVALQVIGSILKGGSHG